MKHTIFPSELCWLTLIALILGACGTHQPIATPFPSTITAAPTYRQTSTDTPEPTFTFTPVEQVQQGPSPRGELQLAYSLKTDQIVFFGGATGDPDLLSSMSGETWIYDVPTNTWTEIKSPSAPRPRDNAGLVYDAESDRMILFGGARPGQICLQDTWSFDLSTKTWTEMKSKAIPMCLGASMVYNSKADRILIFGGWDTKMGKARNDIWSYDYNTDTWTNLEPAVSPPGHQFSSMVYDSKADRVLAWGGWDLSDNGVTNVMRTSVWVYDYNKNTWEERKTENRPSGRAFHAMVYDPKADRTILYGGYRGGYPSRSMWDFEKRNSSETWAYDYNLNTWTLLEPATNPSPLSLLGMAYIPSIDRTLLFGGRMGVDKYYDKTWLFDLNTNTWTEVSRDL